jgi:hypothetical protein
MAKSGSLKMDEALKQAQNSLSIQSVNLKNSKIFVRDDIELASLDHAETKVQSFRKVVKIREISLTDSDKHEFWDYRYIYSAGIRLIFSSEENEASTGEASLPIVEIVGVFEAKYLSKSQVSEECLRAFSTDNIGYHVWPYWREYVQSSCARIGLSPAFEVPFYIFSRDEESDKDSGGL